MTPWSFHRILMGSSGSRCTIRYLTTKWQQQQRKKKKKNDKSERKKTWDWQQFFWLTFYSSSFMSNLYISYKEKKKKKRKQDRPQNWLWDDWLESVFGWRSERNRCGEAFLTPSVTFGHVLFRRKEKKKKKKKKPKQNAFIVTVCSIFFQPRTFTIMNIFKKEKWTLTLKTESERTSSNEFCLAGNSCPCPSPYSPLPTPPPSCTPLICGFL